MDSLPLEIVANILSRTPNIFWTIIQCRGVCKKWHSVLSDTNLTNLLFSLHTCFVFHKKNSTVFKLGLLDDKNRLTENYYDLVTTIKPKFCFLRFSGIDNGLMIYVQKSAFTDKIYICNPLTSEYTLLPVHNIGSHYVVFYGFGYIAAKKQYKVVRFDQRSNPYQSHCEVYTLGTGMWRNLGHLPFGLNYCYQDGVLFNGNLHWLAQDEQHITSDIVCTFDLDKEFSILTASAPLVDQTRYYEPYRSLGVVGGCLCICDNTSVFEIVIWVIQDYGMKECWNKEIVIKKDIYRDRALMFQRVHVIAELKDGSIFMVGNYIGMLSYQRRSKEFQQINISRISQYGMCARVYVPNFISLKSITSETERVLTF